MVVGSVSIGGIVVNLSVCLDTVTVVELGLVVLNGRSDLLGEPALRFIFNSHAAVKLHVTIRLAVGAHGELATGNASDADVFAGRRPAYRAPLGFEVSLAGHE